MATETPQDPQGHTEKAPATNTQPAPQSAANVPLPKKEPAVPLKEAPGASAQRPAAQGGASAHVDLGKILLPRKEVHAPENAQRINAGALFEEEQHATLPPVKKQAPPPAPKKKEESVVQPIETYQGDIEQLVEKKNVSLVSIAAAEAGRRGGSGDAAGFSSDDMSKLVAQLKRIALIAGGLFLLVLASGALFWVLRPAQPVPVEQLLQAPFINIDKTSVITIPAEVPSHTAVMNALDAQRGRVSLSLGLVEWFYLAASSTSPEGNAALTQLSAAQALALLAPRMPGELIRALDPAKYMLGVHSYAGNQAFLILKADSYEAAFSGMLAWEKTMPAELEPLFTYTPPTHIVAVPQETATTSEATATTTATTTSATVPPSAPFMATQFTDAIVENHDARVVRNQNGDIVLLWTFLDRNTIVVTTNDATLREIISRLKNAPIVPIP